MKTLDQVEARTPIPASSSVYDIITPGSYYLAGNITVSNTPGIRIYTDDVTLDLNGYTVKSIDASPSSVGIFLNSVRRNVTIKNGFIRGDGQVFDGTYVGSGFHSGISADNDINVRVSGVSVSGCLTDGIILPYDDTSIAESCEVRDVGAVGISACTVSSCTALQCGANAIYGNQVSDSRGKSFSGIGVNATVANNCYGSTQSGANGLQAITAIGCRGNNVSGQCGLFATVANDCHGYNSGGTAGLLATTANNCRGETSSGDYGLNATTANNCHGTNNSGDYGLYAYTANNSYGYNMSRSAGSYGLYSVYMAIGCYGYAHSGTGLRATTGNSCAGGTSGGTAYQITNKYNMP